MISKEAILECVPNFSEGSNPQVIEAIAQAVRGVDGVQLLNVDPGKATNRTVFTFAGHPDAVIEGAFQAIKVAASLIDMKHHTGEHPRMGATDVCPLVPVSGITLEEAAVYAHQLGERVGKELGIPVYMYEAAAQRPDRKNLATIREGEYEGLESKMKLPDFAPDYGPSAFNAKSGATVIGARDFLVAYNINLNTTSTRLANAVAFDVREQGRVKRTGHPITGEVVNDESGTPIRIPGTLKGVKAIGWYIEEYGIAQISMNLTDLGQTSIHQAFDEVVARAADRGIRVTGSEIVGMVPLSVLVEAGEYFLKKQNRSIGLPTEEKVRIAIKTLGLEELSPFDPKERIIEYKLGLLDGGKLVKQSIKDFAYQTASESPAPGGGSVAAAVGALGIALGTMVANLSANKRGWESKVSFFGDVAKQGQEIMDKLLTLVDADTKAFDGVMAAMGLPKGSDDEKATRNVALTKATLEAAKVPFRTMMVANKAYPVLVNMAKEGNPASASDAGVGALCIHACIEGAFMNVLINLGALENTDFVEAMRSEAQGRLIASESNRNIVTELVYGIIGPKV